jgi:hypothetical protein
MDYLVIQVMSMPCECVFSSAKETDTAKQNKISLVLMEALQLLKFSLKKQCLNFMEGWLVSDSNMRRVKPSHDISTLLVGNCKAAMDTILNNLNQYKEN